MILSYRRAGFVAATALLAILPLSACVPPPAEGPPDILLISIDTLRADHVSAYGYHRTTTPFIDALADEGVRFDQAYSTSSWTAPSVASMLTSSYPTRHGIGQTAARSGRHWSVIPEDLVTLAEILKENGYRTFGLTANFGLSTKRGFGRGFDRYDCAGAVDLEVMREELRPLLAEMQQGEPWFLWLHLFDPHAPYLARESWLPAFWPGSREGLRQLDGLEATKLKKQGKQFGQESLDYVRALYDSEIRHVDDYLREVFEELPRAREAMVLFTADHGEEFLEHDGMLHGRTLFEETIRVPFIVRFPDRQLAGTVVEDPVSLIDVLPTLLGAAGIEPPEGISGVDLFAEETVQVPPGRTIVAELLRGAGLRAGIDGRWKYIHDFGRPENSALFDLVQDPGEHRNLSGSNAGEARRHAKFLQAFTREQKALRTTGGEALITPEQLEALRTLGYVD